MRRELLIGCGKLRDKRFYLPELGEGWHHLTTLDLFDTSLPDVVWDLEKLPLPFDADTFDEIHAYEVLEHTGRQGDWRFFFDQFSDFYRILKPGGLLVGTSPAHSSNWLWGDPGHTRVISPECFVFLDQTAYQEQEGKTSMTDYRGIYQADFQALATRVDPHQFCYILKAHKPSRLAPSETPANEASNQGSVP